MAKLSELEAIFEESNTPKVRLADLEAIIAEDPELDLPKVSLDSTLRFQVPFAGTFDTGVALPESLTAGLISAGRGLTDLARGTGFMDQESPEVKAQFEQLGEEFPVATTVGEITGQTAPFLLPGGALGAIPKLGPRAAAAFGLGVTEGGILANARGATLEDSIKSAGTGGLIASGLEVAVPVVGRLGGAVFRRVTGKAPEGALLDAQGKPTQELTDALEKEGLTFEDLTLRAVQEIAATADQVVPDQAARAANFQSINVPASAGDVTQRLGDQATEARLLENTVDPSAQRFRELKLAQSDAFKRNFQNIVEQSGVPADSGDKILKALEGRQKLLKEEKGRLYREFAETSPAVQQMPIVTDNITEVLPAKALSRRIGRLAPTQKEAFDDLLVEFGLDRDPAKIEKFIAQGDEIQTLNIGNFDEFRQAINAIERTDQTNAINVLTGPVKNALDQEADLLEEAVRKAGVDDESVLAPLREARATVTELKTEFDPKNLTGKLVGTKPKSNVRNVEASQVFKEIFSTSRAPEQVQQVVDNLKKGGAEGTAALGDLQAAYTLDLLDSAFKASSRKIDGEPLFNGGAIRKRFEQLGEEKFNILFENAPVTKRQLLQNLKAASDTQVQSGAVPKGSASVILDLAKSTGITPFLNKSPAARGVLETIRVFSEKGQNAEALEKALTAKPEIIETAKFLERDFPGLAAAAGISGLTVANQEDQENKQ